MKKLILSTALALTTMPVVAQDNRDDVQEMLGFCEEEYPTFSVGVCMGRIQGIYEFLAFNCKYNPDGPSMDAVGVSYGAVQQVFINWANANPKNWNDHWAVGLATALEETFPCNN